ncbi:MAG: hypothetical protein IJZ85_02435 [Lachnospiraceae bacterium]|nr:hypothetical protein [Lachnospiraceae bacterium]
MSSMIEQIFLQILDMSIVAGYCILAVLVIRWMFRKAPKRYSYMLWIVVAFRLLCPLSIESAFSVFNLKLMPEVAVEQRDEQQKEQQSVQLGMSTGMQNDQHLDDQLEVGEPVVGEGIGKLDTPGNQAFPAPESQHEVIGPGNHYQTGTVPEDSAPQSGVNAELNQQGGNQSGALSQPQSGTTDYSRLDVTDTPVRWSQICARVWVGGMAALAVCMLVSWIRLKYQIRFAAKIKNGVYEADGIASAFVLGVIRPRIYLPVGLTKLEQSWILLHENCHKWRKDYLIKMVASMLTAVYWFNPLIWVAWICFCCDMEMSCDEMALEGASPEMRKAYSRTLLSVASDRKGSWHISPAFGENSVKRRIKHILSFRKPAFWVGAVFAMVLILVLAVFGTNGQANENDIINRDGDTVAVGDDWTKGDGETLGTDENPGENADSQGEVIQLGSGLSREFKNVIYRKESLTFEFPYHILDVVSNGEVVYIYSSASGESDRSGGTEIRPLYFALTRCEMDGTQTEIIYAYEETIYGFDELNRENGERIHCMEADEDGNLILVMLYRISKEICFELAKWDANGNVLWSVEIPEGGNGVTSMTCAGDKIIVGGKGSFYVFDTEGNLEKQIPFEKTGENGGIFGLHVTRDDQIYASYYRWNVGSDGYAYPKFGISRLDLKNGTEGEELTWLWGGNYEYDDILPGKAVGYDFDFVMWNEYSVVGWNMGDNLCTEIVNFTDSDIDGNQYTELKGILGNGTFLGVFPDENGVNDEICLLTKVGPEEIADKQVITVGCFGQEELADEVRRFNQSSEKYHVKLWDYSIFGSELQDDMLKLDIEAGNAADIYYDIGNVLLNSFERSEAFENLRAWFENDSELKSEDYLANVFEAYEVDGAWYRLPVAFGINSYSASVADVGNQVGWTIGEARQLITDIPDSQWCWVSQTKNQLLKEAVQFIPFVDEVNGACSFDSKEFIELLEWANEFAETEEWDSSLRKDDLVWPQLIRGYEDFRGLIGESANNILIGFPGAPGNGGYIDTTYGTQFSMSAQSECKEGAWEFLKYFLSDEFQLSYVENYLNGFPVKLSALEAEAEKALREEYYRAPWAGILTEEELDQCIDYMKTLENANRFNYEIYAIVEEEAAAYFSGEATAEAVAEKIQTRVEEYMAQ